MLRLDAVGVLDAVSLVVALSPTLPADLLATRAERVQLPAAWAWVEKDTRAFWYSAAASWVTSLATHILVGAPVLALSAAAIAGVAGSAPIAVLALSLGVLGLYAFSESVLSSLSGFVVFNAMSETYQGHYLSALLAHFGATLAATAATTLTLGGGALLLHGITSLAQFTGGAGLQTIGVFTLLGALPAIVIAGIAIIALPALAQAWALAVSASPREGYEIDEAWLSPVQAALEPERRRDPVLLTAFTVPLPIP